MSQGAVLGGKTVISNLLLVLMFNNHTNIRYWQMVYDWLLGGMSQQTSGHGLSRKSGQFQDKTNALEVERAVN